MPTIVGAGRGVAQAASRRRPRGPGGEVARLLRCRGMNVDEEAQRAAEQAVDEDRLLPGEDPQSSYVDDALHWSAVYAELLQGKSAMLAALIDRVAQAREDIARQELGETDVVVLRHELQRLQTRLDFWAKRRLELEQQRGGDKPVAQPG